MNVFLQRLAYCVQAKPSKIRRPCVYCSEFVTNLSRHIIRKHKTESPVKRLSTMPKHNRIKEMANIRKAGIAEHNRKLISSNEDGFQLVRERKTHIKKIHTDTVKLVKMCSQCKAILDKKYIWRHKKVCMNSDGSRPSSVSMIRFTAKAAHCLSGTSEFNKVILSKFRDDAIGILARSDWTILQVGQYYFDNSPKKEKIMIATHMRRLSMLLIELRKICKDESLCGEDLIDKKYFKQLREAINSVCEKDNGTRNNLKIQLGYLLSKTAEIIHAGE